MKLRALLALALVAAAALSGCFGSDDEPTDDHCDDGHVDADCPDNTLGAGGDQNLGNTTDTNETVEPNVPPVVALKVFDDAGNETRATMLGGNLTFDASGSMDEDGTIDQAAITVTDSNQTRTATLFSNGKFKQATFNFDRPGVVDVTLSVIDDGGEIVNLVTNVFIHHPQPDKSHSFKVPAPPTVSADSCGGTGLPQGSSVLDPNYYMQFKFDVLEGASKVEARVASGSASIAICDPDGNAITGAGTDMVTTEDGTNFTASIAYYVSAVGGTWVPVDSSPAVHQSNAVAVDVIVYYGTE